MRVFEGFDVGEVDGMDDLGKGLLSTLRKVSPIHKLMSKSKLHQMIQKSAHHKKKGRGGAVAPGGGPADSGQPSEDGGAPSDGGGAPGGDGGGGSPSDASYEQPEAPGAPPGGDEGGGAPPGAKKAGGGAPPGAKKAGGGAPGGGGGGAPEEVEPGAPGGGEDAGDEGADDGSDDGADDEFDDNGPKAKAPANGAPGAAKEGQMAPPQPSQVFAAGDAGDESPWKWVLGGAAVLGIGAVVYFKFIAKKKR